MSDQKSDDLFDQLVEWGSHLAEAEDSGATDRVTLSKHWHILTVSCNTVFDDAEGEFQAGMPFWLVSQRMGSFACSKL